ncbi:hypothetical protein [Pseudoflavonifractor sp. An85]|uniref:hypothetical protein n=1 Tax=Pseudoflavonifractor sp. An85 TaxID=1965661 RepID=UPI0011799433|nr:hypothetical protein [Pseudoflavonifractor sp. An85]
MTKHPDTFQPNTSELPKFCLNSPVFVRFAHKKTENDFPGQKPLWGATKKAAATKKLLLLPGTSKVSWKRKKKTPNAIAFGVLAEWEGFEPSDGF